MWKTEKAFSCRGNRCFNWRDQPVDKFMKPSQFWRFLKGKNPANVLLMKYRQEVYLKLKVSHLRIGCCANQFYQKYTNSRLQIELLDQLLYIFGMVKQMYLQRYIRFEHTRTYRHTHAHICVLGIKSFWFIINHCIEHRKGWIIESNSLEFNSILIELGLLKERTIYGSACHLHWNW